MLIIGTKFGQLGNRLLLFSNILANSIEHNYQVVNPHFEEYREYFKGTVDYKAFNFLLSLENKLVAKILSNKISSLSLRVPAVYNLFGIKIISDGGVDFDMDRNANFIELAKNHKILTNGWLFRDKKNLLKHREVIKEIFKPIDRHDANIKENIFKARKDIDTLIGVHIRKGDYSNFKGGIYNYSIEDYLGIISKANQVFKKKNLNAGFLLCSNEEININSTTLKINKSSNHLIEDMYSLAKCDYIIGPPSSFTRWASYYGRTPLYAIENLNNEISLESFRHIYEE